MTDQSDRSRPQRSIAIAVLAAGHGTRMKSATAKHIHPVGGMPIVQRIIRAAQAVQPDHIAVVLSPPMMDLPERLGMAGEFLPVEMAEPTGTASAVLVAIEALPPVDYVVSLLGDSPLLTGDIIQKLIDDALASESVLTILSCELDDAAEYGRIDRDDHDHPVAIIEKANDDESKRTGLTEINSGIMVLQRDWALDALRRLPKDPVRNEYLLTDLVKMAVAECGDGEHWPVDTVPGPEEVSVGVNTRAQQARADELARKIARERLLEGGVTLIGAQTIFIDELVTVGQDTTILPGTILQGTTTIGSGCTIGPHAVLSNATVGDNVTVRSSTIEDATIETGADIGPYSHIRGGSVVGPSVHIGNFVELKNTTMAADAKSGHFSYLGDATIGARVNIGAGTITANYDGITKHHTEIGDDAFIGSDSILVAPVTIEHDARTGAGSVVTRNVKTGQTVVGVPARPYTRKPAAEKE